MIFPLYTIVFAYFFFYLLLMMDFCIFADAFKNYTIYCTMKFNLLSILAFSTILFLSGCGCSGGEYESRIERPDKPHRIANINFKREFNDLNDDHLSAAKKIGVSAHNVENIFEDDIIKKLQLLDDEEAYVVDELTHSAPYLVPRAAELLSEIGRSFQDSLVAHHLPPYKVIVTSVLRTGKDVKKLGRRNINASKNSAHCYATTIDITYKRFHALSDEDEVPQIKLKLVLGEVLRDLKKQGRCYVKHEVKQACFHITAR